LLLRLGSEEAVKPYLEEGLSARPLPMLRGKTLEREHKPH
jgi:hypothetical protein